MLGQISLPVLLNVRGKEATSVSSIDRIGRLVMSFCKLRSLKYAIGDVAKDGG